MGHREFTRSDRVAAQLRRTLSTAIHQNLPDEDTSFITISDVEVTRDLSVATVYINTLHPEQKKLALDTLKDNIPALRKVMASELHSRKIPELRFKYDASLEYGRKMEDLIKQARASDPEQDD
ncbi:30S ribosome-binding factor RbfA [Marinicella gelatinilytica]|uniref:30S ribosome-binding factor RbfA n=1 Tax=Marinicella gelatinilytica TaxID=2996017 RepID=UPI002261029C|nr:30S ribosome-binding factor RbfA [Marinicella gelatinilytica]MCX7544994.1 30S ribosome-binding factor RbfA [Marinicella gelatinilytica]